MAQVAEVTNGYIIDIHCVNNIFAPLGTTLSIVEGGYAKDENTINLILAGPGEYFWLPPHALDVRMRRVLVTYSDNASARFTQRVAQLWWVRVSNDGGLTTPETEAGMT